MLLKYLIQKAMLRSAMNVSPDEKVDEEPDLDESASNNKPTVEEEINADTESNQDVNKTKFFLFFCLFV